MKQSNLTTHIGNTGTAVHGLGTASTHAATDFDTSGAASAVQSNLTTHTGNTGTAVHGLGTVSTINIDSNAAHYLNGAGLWTTPSGAGEMSFSNRFPANDVVIPDGYWGETAEQLEIALGHNFELGSLSIFQVE